MRIVNIALLLAAATVAQGASIVTSEAALGPTDHIDWAGLGPEGTLLPTPTNGLTVNGNPYQVSLQAGFGLFVRLDEWTTWFGNFGNGESLLNNIIFGPIEIAFANPVAGAGAQIQSTLWGPFTAKIEAFDIGNNLIGSFTEAGNSTVTNDDTAIFLGIKSTQNDISKVRFSLTAASFGLTSKFAIGDVALVQTPEPSTFALAGGALAVAALRVLRRRGFRTAA